MTVICWDGKTLAADKQSTNCGHGSVVTKIHRVPDGIVGFTGDGCHAHALLAWFMRGRPEDHYPRAADEDVAANAMFVDASGKVFGYSGFKGPHPILYESKFLAAGAGRDYALAAMHLGLDARRAVEVACELDISCGNGIDTLELL